MDTPGTVDQCLSLLCETAALRWPGPRFLQPAAGSDEARSKRYYRHRVKQQRVETSETHDVSSSPSVVWLCTSVLAGWAVVSMLETALARFLAAPSSCCPFPPSSSMSAASSLTPFDISVRLEEIVVTAQPTAV